jgi:hypothetical protein
MNNTLVRKKELTSKTKMQIFTIVYKPTLICGSGSWTVLDKHDSRFTAAEMRFLRAAAGKTKWDRVRNVTIREELKQKPLVEQIKTATMVRTCNKDGTGEETKADVRSQTYRKERKRTPKENVGGCD